MAKDPSKDARSRTLKRARTPVTYSKRTGTGTFLVTSTPASPSWGTLVSENLPGGEITFSSGVFTVVDAGQYRFGAYLTVNSNSQRAQVAAEVYIDGAAVGDQRGGAYVRNAGASYDYWTVEVAPEIHDLTAGQTIEIRIGQVTGSTFGFSGSYTINCHEDKSRCWIERLGAGQKGDPGPAGSAPLAEANQTLTAHRTIDDGDNGYSFFVDLNAGGGDTCQFLLNPAAPSATWKAQSAGTDSVTLLNTGVRLNLLFAGSADLALDSDAGAAGECITSTGSGSAPVYQGFPVIRSATAPTNTSLFWFDTGLTNPELFFYDSTRSKWLSVAIYLAPFGRGGTLTASHYMRGPGNFDYTTAGEIGVPLKFDATVVGAWGSVPGGGTSGWTKRVMRYDDSASANTVGGTYAPAGTYNRWEKLDFDIDYDADDLLALNVFNGGSATGIANHTALVAYRRRTS